MRVVEYRPRCMCVKQLVGVGLPGRVWLRVRYPTLPVELRCVFHARVYRRAVRPTITHATQRWPFRWPWSSA